MRTRMRLLRAVLVAFSLFIGGLAAQSLSSYVRTDKAEAVIEVRAGQQSSFRIPRTVYGIYTEKGIFEGISAQLLDNPSLEDYYGYLPALNARFSDPAFANSLTMGLPLPWQALRNVGKRYESRFRRRSGQLQSLSLPNWPATPGAEGDQGATRRHNRGGRYPPGHLPAGSSGTRVYGVSVRLVGGGAGAPDGELPDPERSGQDPGLNRGSGAGWREMDEAPIPPATSSRGREVA